MNKERITVEYDINLKPFKEKMEQVKKSLSELFEMLNNIQDHAIITEKKDAETYI